MAQVRSQAEVLVQVDAHPLEDDANMDEDENGPQIGKLPLYVNNIVTKGCGC